MSAPLPACAASHRTGLAHALLREIAWLLNRLNETGEEGAIDLRSLPMTDADREELKELLGSGEVSANLEVAGASSVEETGFAGVWWVRHFAGDERVVSEQIVVTRVPEILIAHRDDITAASKRIMEIIEAEPSAVAKETTP